MCSRKSSGRIRGYWLGLPLDQDQETLIKLRGARLKSYAEKFAPPAQLAGQYLSNLGQSLGAFLRNDFYMKSDLNHLIELFYRSLVEGTREDGLLNGGPLIHGFIDQGLWEGDQGPRTSDRDHESRSGS